MSKVRYLWRYARKRLGGQKTQSPGTALPPASHAAGRTRRRPLLPWLGLRPDSPLARLLFPDESVTIGSPAGNRRRKTRQGTRPAGVRGRGRGAGRAGREQLGVRRGRLPSPQVPQSGARQTPRNPSSVGQRSAEGPGAWKAELGSNPRPATLRSCDRPEPQSPPCRAREDERGARVKALDTRQSSSSLYSGRDKHVRDPGSPEEAQ